MARIVVTIDRTSLSLGTLTLGEGTNYHLPDGWLNVGTSEYRRNTPTAPNSPGRQLTDHVLDTVTFTAKVNIGLANQTSVAAVWSAFGVLIAAVRQESWTFQVAYDGAATMKWTCEPAAIAPDFTSLFMQGMLPVTLTVPRSPIPVTGPF